MAPGDHSELVLVKLAQVKHIVPTMRLKGGPLEIVFVASLVCPSITLALERESYW